MIIIIDMIISILQREVSEKVDAALAKAPLTILPIKTPAHLISRSRANLAINTNDMPGSQYQTNLLISSNSSSSCSINNNNKDNEMLTTNKKSLSLQDITTNLDDEVGAVAAAASVPSAAGSSSNVSSAASPICAHTLSLKDTGNLSAAGATVVGRLSPLLNMQATSSTIAAKTTGKMTTDLLFSSPIFNYTPFYEISQLNDDVERTDSMDGLNISEDCRGYLTNINYDFDFSDQSADNSVAENIVTSDPAPIPATPINLAEFDPLLNADTHHDEDILNNVEKLASVLLNDDNDQIKDKPKSLLESDTPPNDGLLSSPLIPTTSDYRGFSNFQIPIISCNTGDCSLTNTDYECKNKPKEEK